MLLNHHQEDIYIIHYTANILYNISILIYNRRQKYPGYRGILKCPWAKFSTSLIKYFLSSNGERDILLTLTVWS